MTNPINDFERALQAAKAMSGLADNPFDIQKNWGMWLITSTLFHNDVMLKFGLNAKAEGGYIRDYLRGATQNRDPLPAQASVGYTDGWLMANLLDLSKADKHQAIQNIVARFHATNGDTDREAWWHEFADSISHDLNRRG